MAKNNSLWAKSTTKIYILSYLTIISIIFIIPIIMLILGVGNVTLLGANLYFFELNLFFALVLMFYTYVIRHRIKNWNIYLYLFVASFVYLVVTMFAMMI